MTQRLVILALVVIIAGAAGAAMVGPSLWSVPRDAGSDSTSIVDYAGRNVTLPRSPQRIVSLSGDITEILYAIGAEEKIVGVDRYSSYPAGALNKTNVGTSSALNLETMVSLQPDLVIIWSYQTGVIPALEQNNITVVVIDAISIDDILDTIRFIGSVCGNPGEAEALASNMSASIDSIRAKTGNLSGAERPLVYFEGMTALRSYNANTFTNDIISIAGGINLAANESQRYPTLSSEYVILMDPDVIIVISSGASVDEIKARSGWQGISAVKNERVYEIDVKWISSNPRVVLGIEQVARLLHPELFG